ncbi:Capsule biosynthesis protein capA [Candidatus Syntrophocurvum alkaliphilum]|uniref:Capsule biosynthesis protein capA n=1 Tax=Candidatus Syntrophocurvum alkaliphilum TaxID=2293317 RepID=A0A6I6DEP0_9FIRM|nr:CapA family protein [Candidatus Syntrophocurvum alkaliphilum]QGU00556.1 Capsule biosynthesis protein capA [Candidatus Syntrophocurvum alkaliphilum]
MFNKIMINIKHIALLTLFLLTSFILIGCNDIEGVFSDKKTKEPPKVDEKKDELLKEEPEETHFRITAVGDIMVHGPQIRAQFNAENNNYNFDNNFTFVKPYFKQSDILIGNLETTFAGEDRGYSGYPMFNAPDELAKTLSKKGFDYIVTANNHSIDKGKQGLKRTVDILEKNNLKAVGTRKNLENPGYYVENINGVNVGITAFTYETPLIHGHRSLNGIIMDEELSQLVDSFSYQNLEEEVLNIKNRIKKLKDLGAELTIVYMHWGNEYQTYPSMEQKKVANKLANFGVDIIFGSHPHVIQPFDIIKSNDAQHETLVFYSLGNFISNQRLKYLDTRLTEKGIIVNIDLKEVEGEISYEEITYTPTWVHKYQYDGQVNYEILPLPDVLNNQKLYNLPTQKEAVAANAKLNTKDKITEINNNLFLEPVLEEEKIKIE